MAAATGGELRWGTPAARWVIAATVLGSGIAFLDGTIVNVALPAIGRDLKTDVAGLQWTLDAYLVTLTAFLLFGGALGDRFGRKRDLHRPASSRSPSRASRARSRPTRPCSRSRARSRARRARCSCPAAWRSSARRSTTWTAAARSARGPGLAGVAGAVGPFVGGWLIDAFSWRWVFLINVPLAIVAVAITVRHVPESRADTELPLDVVGAVLAAVGLAAVCWALIEGGHEFGAAEVALGASSASSRSPRSSCVEHRSSHPMLPLRLFRNKQFSGVNGTTLAVYAALGGALFMVVLELQLALGYSALEAGAAMVPTTLIMFFLSPRAGALAQRIGARLPMTIGPMVIAVGLLLFTRSHPGAQYLTTVLPAVIVFGLGLSATVAPLTVDRAQLGAGLGARHRVGREQRRGPARGPAVGGGAARRSCTSTPRSRRPRSPARSRSRCASARASR